MEKKKKISNIISINYVRNVGKSVVELAVVGESKKTIWLSEKQLANLNACFDQTKNGYSDKNVSVYGHWNDNGYYAYTSVLHHKQPKRFKEPVQRDVSDLWEVD